MMYLELRSYKKTHGDALVHSKSGPLGYWVGDQRKLYRKKLKGEKTPLTDERVEALNELGFVWAPVRGLHSHIKSS